MRDAYEGEAGCNAYKWGKEHLADLERKSKDSVIGLRSLNHHHQGRENVKYIMKLKKLYKEPLDRQL